MSYSHWGLCYYSVQAYRFISLPLITARATASIKDLSAQVKVIQSFTNDAPLPIEAIYSFPIPARAAVCGFVMVRQNGTRVKGIVQEKTEAKQTYDTAVSQGKTASLMTQETPDVFQVAVGNILPNEEVSIELIYATELSEDEESDSVRFHLPTHIGARYGHAPTISGTQATTVDVAVSVESIAPIRKIGSPSHSISTELGPDSSLPNAQELPFSNYARVSFYSTAPLDKDFVLNIQSAGLDAPRCIAELHPNNDTVALSLTLVPKFNLPDRATQEFIFLVDRSGSMQGHRIAAARKALVIMLRSLPRKDTIFQIVSFGNKTTFMWPQGRLYDQETLDYATQHVDGMSADYGGTEIQGALSMTFSKRRTDRATNVFVLTDGDAWNLDGVLAEVTNAVEASKDNAPLRVFCLGIGNSASTAMCQGLARCGKGACMMVGEQEASMTGKIARLVKAARMPVLKDITVDWGRKSTQTEKELEEDFEIVDDEESPPKEKPKLNIFDESVSHMDVDASSPPPPKRIVLPAPSEVQQSPAKVEILLSGVRLYVYAILQGKDDIPKNVTLRGRTDDGAEIELPVNVNLSQLPNESSAAPPAIHALAARRIIQDYEDGYYNAILRKESAFDLERLRKAHMVRLGTTFSITSSHTSFVAVDESSHTTLPTLFHPAGSKSTYKQRGAAPSPPVSPLYANSVPPPPPGMARARYKMSAGGRGRGSFSFGSASPKASFSPPPAPTSFSGGAPISAIGGRASPMGYGAAPSASFASPPPPAPGAFFSGAAPREVVVDTQPMQQYSSSQRTTSSVPTTDPLETLARLQGFDGSFADLAKVVRATTALDESAVRTRFPAGLDVRVVATLLARAFIQNAMKRANVEEKVAWEGIDEKADEYLRETVGEYEKLLEVALRIVL